MELGSTHPYWHVQSVLKGAPNISSVFASYYVYQPQSLFDSRRTFEVSRSRFLNQVYVESLVEACPPLHEIAFHSAVSCNTGEVKHLPMVDMATEDLGILAEVNDFLVEGDFHGFVWYESGRSFHGYGSLFISHSEWILLMGKLLLCNPRSGANIVDPRWIGHRLIGGYSALRWSKNTPQYHSIPRRLQLKNVLGED